MRLRWLCGDREGFTADYERALAADPRNIAPVAVADPRSHAGRPLRAWRWSVVLRGRALAGPHLVFDVNEAVRPVASWASSKPPNPCSPASPRSRIDTVRIRHVRHLLRTGRPAEAAALAETMIEDARRRLVLALSVDRLAAAGRPALGMAGRG